jgi:hypothetical protein
MKVLNDAISYSSSHRSAIIIGAVPAARIIERLEIRTRCWLARDAGSRYT